VSGGEALKLFVVQGFLETDRDLSRGDHAGLLAVDGGLAHGSTSQERISHLEKRSGTLGRV
jgi:hypothetical protein